MWKMWKKMWMKKKESRIVLRLQHVIMKAREGAFGFMIRDNETLQEGMARNYQEFSDERERLNKRVEILEKMIIDVEMVKLCNCPECWHLWNFKQYRQDLLTKLDTQLLIMEAQDDKTKNDS